MPKQYKSTKVKTECGINIFFSNLTDFHIQKGKDGSGPISLKNIDEVKQLIDGLQTIIMKAEKGEIK